METSFQKLIHPHHSKQSLSSYCLGLLLAGISIDARENRITNAIAFPTCFLVNSPINPIKNPIKKGEIITITKIPKLISIFFIFKEVS